MTLDDIGENFRSNVLHPVLGIIQSHGHKISLSNIANDPTYVSFNTGHTIDELASKIYTKEENYSFFIPDKGTTSMQIISEILQISPDFLQHLNSGAVKSVFLLADSQNKFVARLHTGDYEQYWQNRLKGLTEAKITMNFPTIAAAKINDIPGIPLDICEYALPVACVKDFINSSQSLLEPEKNLIMSRIYSMMFSNPLVTLAPSRIEMERDSGLVIRDDKVYVVQFDFSHFWRYLDKNSSPIKLDYTNVIGIDTSEMPDEIVNVLVKNIYCEC